MCVFGRYDDSTEEPYQVLKLLMYLEDHSTDDLAERMASFSFSSSRSTPTANADDLRSTWRCPMICLLKTSPIATLSRNHR